MENTRLPDTSAEEAAREGRIKYIAVVLQYVGKLHKDKLIDAVRALEGNRALGKKQYNWRLTSSDTSDELSGSSTFTQPTLIHCI